MGAILILQTKTEIMIRHKEVENILRRNDTEKSGMLGSFALLK